jgi:hypothetical protein
LDLKMRENETLPTKNEIAHYKCCIISSTNRLSNNNNPSNEREEIITSDGKQGGTRRGVHI